MKNDFFRNLDKRLEHSDIDLFLEHLKKSLDESLKALDKQYQTVKPEEFEHPDYIDSYKMHLEELFDEALAAKRLGDELSILALFKRIETHKRKILKKIIPSLEEKKLSSADLLDKVLPFIHKDVNDHAAFDELRLINNALKHNGKVTASLSKKYPHWAENTPFEGLDEAYLRLLPCVKRYVADFVDKTYQSRLLEE